MKRWIHVLVGVAVAMASGVGVGVGVGATGVHHAFAEGTTLFVAPTGSDTMNGCRDSSRPCKTLGHALARATAGYTIQLAPGIYGAGRNPEGTANVVGRDLYGVTIRSDPVAGVAANTVIDAAGTANGLEINAANVTVKRLTFIHAHHHGILVTPPPDTTTPAAISGVTISENVVEASGGSGIELVSTTGATVDHNTVIGNARGIVLTDSLGPSDANTVTFNKAIDNSGAGISLASRNTKAVTTRGLPRQFRGGVYRNKVTFNNADRNGGDGIALTARLRGTAVWADTVEFNRADDNGGPGIAIRTNSPFRGRGTDIVHANKLDRDALTGNHGGAGDAAAGERHTTAILVAARIAPSATMWIHSNLIAHVFYGAWISGHVVAARVEMAGTEVLPGGTPTFVQPAAHPKIVGIASNLEDGRGYWQVDQTGAVFPFGAADFYGSMSGIRLNAPVVGIVSRGYGYLLVAADGGVFAFGPAQFSGSTGARHLETPIVGMAEPRYTSGYWLVDAHGRVFAFGNARNFGSMKDRHLDAPIVGIANRFLNGGYWLIARDGKVFSFGAPSHGSVRHAQLGAPIVAMVSTAENNGYWIVSRDGRVFSFGRARTADPSAEVKNHVSGIAVTPVLADGEGNGDGFWLSDIAGHVYPVGEARPFGSEFTNLAHR